MDPIVLSITEVDGEPKVIMTEGPSEMTMDDVERVHRAIMKWLDERWAKIARL